MENEEIPEDSARVGQDLSAPTDIANAALGEID